MKKRILAFGLVCALTLGMPVAVSAEEKESVVRFSSDKEFVYEDINLDAFEGMLPGETAVQKIKITNEYKDAIDFFLAQETVEEIKHANSAAGGSFVYSISVGTKEDGSNAVSLLEKEIGGTSEDGTTLEAFTGIDELKDYSYVAKLNKGESTYIFLSLYIDGEGNDNQKKATDEENEDGLYGYSNFLSTLSFDFRAYDGTKVIVDDPEPTIIDRITEIVKNPPYKGGDTTSKVAYTVVIAMGAAVIIFAIIAAKKKKGDQKDE